ncbi:hypothetical protein Snas_3311 [Stackebrandtia nassauensis DSM 44728]|uniref:Uncharacterized protein n=1 Tax=Stackebrandtia nassauensis (strain DSM 44728 / CIP 108903 / NRRL B-16338 / NBRC 102104 / LLR-40K-21) TaxID=446470 RepID=D3PUG4_STANL|nr:hypothetical protein Snas_3311 [Stackebrandtia nassauensis DSM 44728]
MISRIDGGNPTNVTAPGCGKRHGHNVQTGFVKSGEINNLTNGAMR